MNTKKIFLTTMSELEDRNNIDYYVCDVGAEYGTYTTSMSIAEAGIKYILSQYDIDEIIVLGSEHNATKEEKKSIQVSDINIKNVHNIKSMSDYGFLSYRISEFLSQLDFEYVDTQELIENDVKEKIKNELKDFKKNNNIVGDREIFYRLSEDRDLYELFKKDIYEKHDLNEQKWIKHFLYSEMDSYYKMHIRDYNLNTNIRYIDIKDRGLLSIDTITNIANEILNEKNKEVELYIDLQGLTPTDGSTMFSTFMMANRRIGYKCDLRSLINTKRDRNAFSGIITGAYDSYNTQKLIEAIYLFLDYGKDRPLKEYWQSLNIKNEKVDTLFAAMDCIDEGITLCNVDLIMHGMRYIKKIVDEYEKAGVVNNIYLDFIINCIKVDYGEILDKEDVYIYDLLKWLLKKGFYQQILTLIESKIPDDMVERGIYYYAKNEDDVNLFLEKVNLLYWNEVYKMRWQFNDVNHFFVKSYGRAVIDNRQKPDFVSRDLAKLRVEALKNNNKELSHAYSDLKNDELLYDLFYTYYRIGNLRNQVNHAEYLESDLNEETLLKRKDIREDIKTELSKFINIYEKACKSCNDNKIDKNRIVISTQQLKGYTRNHELKILDTNSDLVNKNTYSCDFNGKEVKIDIKLFKLDEFRED